MCTHDPRAQVACPSTVYLLRRRGRGGQHREQQHMHHANIAHGHSAQAPPHLHGAAAPTLTPKVESSTMPLEATMVCVDNSEWMRNGDFTPTRFEVRPPPPPLPGLNRGRGGKRGPRSKDERHGGLYRPRHVHRPCTTPVGRALAGDRTHGDDSKVGQGAVRFIGKGSLRIADAHTAARAAARAGPWRREPRGVPRVSRCTRSGAGRHRHGALAKEMRGHDRHRLGAQGGYGARTAPRITVGTRGRTRPHARACRFAPRPETRIGLVFQTWVGR